MKKRKILLLNPPSDNGVLYSRDYYCSASSKADYYWPPMDLLVLSGILKEDHDISVIDSTMSNHGLDQSLNEIKEVSPEIIIFVTSTPTIEKDMEFLKNIKNEIGCKIYGSGNFLYFETARSMKDFPFLDGIILDFTSESIRDFFRGERKNITDIVYRDGKEIIETKLSLKKDFSYPVPQHELFPIKKYHLPHAKRRPITSMIINFGCPFKCSFCFCGKFSFRERELDNVIEELEYVKKIGVKEIYFRDYTFTVNNEYVKELCRKMIDKKLDLTWVTSTRADLLDKETVLLMKEAGCHTIQIGVESGNDKVLKDFDKSVDKKKLTEGFKFCRKYGIRTLAHFILGLPGETRETVEDTIKFAKELKCDYASFNIFIPIFGTDARETVIEKGWLKSTELSHLDSSSDDLTVETPWLSGKDLTKLRKKAIISFYMRPGYILRMIASTRSLGNLKEYAKNAWALVKIILKK